MQDPERTAGQRDQRIQLARGAEGLTALGTVSRHRALSKLRARLSLEMVSQLVAAADLAASGGGKCI